MNRSETVTKVATVAKSIKDDVTPSPAAEEALIVLVVDFLDAVQRIAAAAENMASALYSLDQRHGVS